MREIKFIGLTKRGNDKRNYRYSIFECPNCLSKIERKTRDGIKAKVCSHSCYAATREVRGSYREYVIISGYRYMLQHNHPKKTKKGYVAEHRLIAEQKIGRFLNDDEDVHHINENKLDNRPENLIVLSKSEHMKLHKRNAGRSDDGKFKI
jgi:hypothetical protein